MNRILSILVGATIMTTASLAEEGFRNRPITNNLSMPTGYTLHANEFTVGLGTVNYGIAENFQAGTNVLLFLFQIYNANVKYSFYKKSTGAVAAGLDFARFDLPAWDKDTQITFTSISPFLAYSRSIGNKTTLHASGQYSFYSSDADIEDAKAEAQTTGTSFSLGLENNLSVRTKYLVEGGYDLTFKGLRAGGGFLWGWEKFRLKVGVAYFKPEKLDGFTFPYIGLWWRFKA